jgi:protein KRI1
VSHPREVEGSVRRKDSKRAAQREAKKARKAAEKARRDEQVKRLKNLKKKEIENKLMQLQASAGLDNEHGNSDGNGGSGGGDDDGGAAAAAAFARDDLEDDWDPAAHDAYVVQA